MTIQEVRKYEKIIRIGSVAGVTEERGVKREWWLPTPGKKGKKKKKRIER